ncbi:FG-GAP-like repeat-containing protein [Bradyrhizobium sp. CCBAU 11386]|uniref:FG-GAP-like repeat-containing protein n=1 Tax=Bradyrhizobium sp. CCBAU 11386 TaxID=1630837 RepID=UPI0023022E8F|nr:FG-GAP-like repeat-containing protein [Bradyrhizobium sp. CCBAU 11386]
MATAVTVSATNNAEIDGLLSGAKWSGTITYSFPDSPGDYANPYSGGYSEPTTSGFASAPSQMQAAINYAIGLILGYTNANIQYAGTNGADIMVAQSPSANPTSYAYYPGNYASGGDIWFGTQYNYSLAALGNYYFTTALHELGHALGLKHSQETGGVANVAVPSAHDDSEYTVMSYRSYVGGSTTSGYTNEAYGFSQTYMANDILALQTMYGADYTTQSSNTVYTWNPTTGQEFINGVGQLAPGGGVGGSANRIYETVWDGGGVDTYDLSNYTTNLSINLNPGASSVFSTVQLANLGNGHYASGNVYNAYLYNNDARSYIDNVIGGSGNDTIVGNTIANTLNGGTGNDTITGGGGNDTIIGGAGTDTAVYSGSEASYAISYNSTTQTFTIVDLRSGSPDGTDAVTGVENFRFGDGTIASATMMGNLQPAGAGWVATIEQDFNSDGYDDILWLQPSTGAGKIAYLSNGTATSLAPFTTLGQGWIAIGHGDYNHDGNIDILWQNQATGEAKESLLSAGHISATFDFGVMGADWQLISSGDFNGDRTDDMLWRNKATGEGIEWFLHNGYATSWMRFGVMTPEWKVASTVDLNQDGTTDILWQNTNTGEGLEWFCNNGFAVGWQKFGTMGAGWNVVASADFNSDGRVDLLWQDPTSGRLVEWFVNDQGYAFDWKDLGTPGSNWKVAGLLDLHAGSGPTILMQNVATGITTEITSAVAGAATLLASLSASSSPVRSEPAGNQSLAVGASGSSAPQNPADGSLWSQDHDTLNLAAHSHDFMLL